MPQTLPRSALNNSGKRLPVFILATDTPGPLFLPQFRFDFWAFVSMSFPLEQPYPSHFGQFLDGSPSRTWDSALRVALEFLPLCCCGDVALTPSLSPPGLHSRVKQSLTRCSKSPEAVTWPRGLPAPSQVPLGCQSLIIWICSQSQSSSCSSQLPLGEEEAASEGGV